MKPYKNSTRETDTSARVVPRVLAHFLCCPCGFGAYGSKRRSCPRNLLDEARSDWQLKTLAQWHHGNTPGIRVVCHQRNVEGYSLRHSQPVCIQCVAQCWRDVIVSPDIGD